jgi:subtilase family serine protease
MSDKLSVHLWGMSANAEGQLAIAAIIFIVVIVAVVTVVAKRRA